MNINYFINKINKSNINTEKKNELLESASKTSLNNLPIILNTFQLSNVLGCKWKVLKEVLNNIDLMYHTFYIKKKSGGYRVISAPNEKLKLIQNRIKEKILDKIIISDCAYGFIKNKNIIDNANQHLNQQIIMNIDIKDFFPSIKLNRVYFIFNKVCGYTKDISYFLMKLVTFNNSLPQGAPTSPIISNIVSYKLDKRLKSLSDSKCIKYTRYADDITFSGNIATINYSFLYCVSKIIEDCGFEINKTKTRFATKSQKQEVTGLIVNNNIVSIPKTYIREIRQELYYISKFGLKNHREKVGFRNLYYKEHLLGKILYVKSINNSLGDKFLEKYNSINFN